MYRALFQMVGAFLIWTSSGFKGKYQDELGRQRSYRQAVIGLSIFVFVVVAILTTINLVND